MGTTETYHRKIADLLEYLNTERFLGTKELLDSARTPLKGESGYSLYWQLVRVQETGEKLVYCTKVGAAQGTSYGCSYKDVPHQEHVGCPQRILKQLPPPTTLGDWFWRKAEERHQKTHAATEEFLKSIPKDSALMIRGRSFTYSRRHSPQQHVIRETATSKEYSITHQELREVVSAQPPTCIRPIPVGDTTLAEEDREWQARALLNGTPDEQATFVRTVPGADVDAFLNALTLPGGGTDDNGRDSIFHRTHALHDLLDFSRLTYAQQLRCTLFIAENATPWLCYNTWCKLWAVGGSDLLTRMGEGVQDKLIERMLQENHWPSLIRFITDSPTIPVAHAQIIDRLLEIEGAAEEALSNKFLPVGIRELIQDAIARQSEAATASSPSP